MIDFIKNNIILNEEDEEDKSNDNINTKDKDNEDNNDNDELESPIDNEDEENNEDDDFNMDDSDNDSLDFNSDDESSSNTSQSSTEDEPVEGDENQNSEKELFDDLTPNQIKLRDKELLRQYKIIYNTIESISSKMNKYYESTSNTKRCSFIISKTETLKDILSDYIMNLYKTKSYIENMSNYYEFVSIITSINEMISDLADMDNKRG